MGLWLARVQDAGKVVGIVEVEVDVFVRLPSGHQAVLGDVLAGEADVRLVAVGHGSLLLRLADRAANRVKVEDRPPALLRIGHDVCRPAETL